MNKKIILVIAIILIIGLIYYFDGMKKKNFTAFSNDKKAPELTGIVGYINVEDGIKISDYLEEGKVVLIDFWTYTCINCIRTLPHLREWHGKYKDKGLAIIGVHTPEFEFEKRYDNVKKAVEKYGIEYPVVLDNDYATWRAFQNNYWPRKYLIDSKGNIRYDHIGEGGYEETEKKIMELLEEAGGKVNMNLSGLEDETPMTALTPELYSGYRFALPRGQNIGNKEGLQTDNIYDYKLLDKISNDRIYLNGKWESKADYLEAKGDSEIILNFLAGSVNIVGEGKGLKLEIFIDDRALSREQAGDDIIFEDGKAFVVIGEARLYNLFKNGYGRYKLKINAENNFRFNAFTFG